MTQLRYIAMTPVMRRDAHDVPIRDDDGKIEIVGHRLHHNARLYEEANRAKREANAFMRNGFEGFGRALVVDIDELADADIPLDEQYQYAERMMIKWAAEHGRLADIVHDKIGDKSDRDYHVRVKRNAEFKAHATTELRRLVEMFKPPDFQILVERNKPVHDWENGKPRERVWPFVVVLRDPNPDGSDAHIFVRAETEGGCYANLLTVILDGRGFFPGT